MSSATFLDKPSVPSVWSTWRTDGNLRYEVAMNTIIITLIIDAVLHMTLRDHKIPLDDNLKGPVFLFGMSYAFVIISNCMLRFLASEVDDGLSPGNYFLGRLGHTFGFCIFLCLLYSISHLAMYVALPCLLWFVPAMFAPCCPCLWRGKPAWWNFVQ